jgi:hypothetical protein
MSALLGQPKSYVIQNLAFLLVKINYIYIYKYYWLKKILPRGGVRPTNKVILGNICHCPNGEEK